MRIMGISETLKSMYKILCSFFVFLEDLKLYQITPRILGFLPPSQDLPD